MKNRAHFGWWVLGFPLLLLISLPVIALTLHASPTEIGKQLVSDEGRSAIAVTVRTTTLSLFLLLVCGTPLAYVLSLRRPSGVLETVIGLPAILPPSVAGIALLLAFGRMGVAGPWLGTAGIRLPFTATAVVLSQLFVATPFYLRPTISAFRTVDPHLAEAAALDGANSVEVLSHIVIPSARNSMVAGASLAWARALGEFGATILFAGNRLGETRTMPLAIYLGFETNLDQAVALSCILLAVAAGVLILVRTFERT